MAVIEHLSEAECWTLLEGTRVGRLAVGTADGPDIFPLTYAVHGGALYFRSAPGTKLAEVAADPRVAFEIDGRFTSEDGAPGRHWSVVVRGTARRLDADDEILESGVQDLLTAIGGEQYNYVQITPARIEGRRL